MITVIQTKLKKTIIIKMMTLNTKFRNKIKVLIKNKAKKLILRI
jgi:hypothetical protein